MDNESVNVEPSVTPQEVESEISNKVTQPVEEEATYVVKQDKNKIDVLLRATGNAPILKKKKWSVEHDRKICMLIDFIKKYLNLDASENLFVYVNQSFAPSPDQTIKNLYDCFGSDGKLVLHYCKSQAWG